jgi:hypothetical protein
MLVLANWSVLKLMRMRLLVLVLVVAGCSNSPERYQTPEVDVTNAAAQAIQLYDANRDDALDKNELAKCPGMLARLAAYDSDGSESVSAEEIESHLGRLLNGVGGTQLTAAVYYKNRPLKGAKVVMEPEPYLGDAIQAAEGETDGSGTAKLGIPPEYAPEHLRRLKTVHYGTFKVRITHPSIELPAKYNTQTELGYETEPGNSRVTFALQ